MKKLLPLFVLFISVYQSNAQCVPDGSITTPGLIAPVESIDCISQGVNYSDIIQFRNFDSIYFNNNWVQLQQLRIDSVNNLPCGINWALSNPDKIYDNSEQGCIQLSGVTNDSVGQYKLDIWASIDLGSGFFGPLQANNFDLLTFYVKVKTAAGACPVVDTTAFEHTSFCNSIYGLPLESATSDTLCLSGNTTLSVDVEGGSGYYQYSWAPADNLSCTDCPNPTLEAQSVGQYDYVLTVTDSISTIQNTQLVSVYVDICDGIEEHIYYGALSIYPNPGNGLFTVELPENIQANSGLVVRNIHGQEVLSETITSSGRAELDMTRMNSGIYFLSILAGDKQFVNKLIVR